VFVVAAAVGVVAFALTWLIEERPLRQTVETSGLDDVFAPPRDSDSTRELLRELSRQAGREETRAFIARQAAAAGVDLDPLQIGILGRVAHGEPVERPLFGDLPPEAVSERARGALAELRERGLVGGEPPALTAAGNEVFERIRAAREDAVRTLVAEWDPSGNPAIDPIVCRLAESLDEPAGVN
jgi:hypothetical protein